MPAHFPVRIAFLAGSWPAPSSCSLGSERRARRRAHAVPRAQRHEYRHEIDQVEDAWRTAMLKGNSTALAALLADDYTAITAKGAIQTKDQARRQPALGSVPAYCSEHLRPESPHLRNYRRGHLPGRAHRQQDDQDITGRYRYTRVYVRNAQGQWKIVSFEASRIQESTEHK